MSVALTRVVGYLNRLMQPDQYTDFCPNGLQVQGKPTIERIVSGVTASYAFVEQAIDVHQADLLLVHHGYFWRHEPAVLVGMKAKRIRMLFKHDVSLLAYHIPLDVHEKYGNNVQLAEQLDATITGTIPVPGYKNLLYSAQFDRTYTYTELAAHLEDVLQRPPLYLGNKDSKKTIRTLGICTGAAQDYIVQAAQAGLDAFITGEASERTTHLAKELDIHFFAAGHHATERYGVQRLGQRLAEVFRVEHRFLDRDNPV